MRTRAAGPVRLASSAPVRCPRCGGSPVEERCETGPHFARQVCGDCGRFQRWLPRPSVPSSGPPAEILDAARRSRRPLARLVGASESQCRLASSVRARMLAAARERGDADRALVLKAIASAAWFCGHLGRSYTAIRWPCASQLAAEEPP